MVDSAVQAEGSVWFGKVAAPETSVDVAVVWPLMLGIHRDSEGVFFDQALELATAGSDGAAGEISALTALGGMFPDWKFTLAVEPVVLSQLRDMADGYPRIERRRHTARCQGGGWAGSGAAAALSALKDIPSSERREVIVTPYAAPSMEFLAEKGMARRS